MPSLLILQWCESAKHLRWIAQSCSLCLVPTILQQCWGNDATPLWDGQIRADVAEALATYSRTLSALAAALWQDDSPAASHALHLLGATLCALPVERLADALKELPQVQPAALAVSS